MTIDEVAGGALMDKAFTESYQPIESMAQNHYEWGTKHNHMEKAQQKGGMFKVNGLDHVSAKVNALTQQNR